MTEKYSAQPSVCVCPSRNQLESEEIVADLVHCFLLPEVQKNTVRDKSESSPSFRLLLSAGGGLRPLRFRAGQGWGVFSLVVSLCAWFVKEWTCVCVLVKGMCVCVCACVRLHVHAQACACCLMMRSLFEEKGSDVVGCVF